MASFRRWPSWIVVIALAFSSSAQAHNLDTSYARFKVSKEAIECKFTFDLLSLVRMIPNFDSNVDRQISVSELAAHSSEVYEYLRKAVRFEINGKAEDFGQAQPVHFPPDVGDSIPEQDYHAATSLVHFGFRKSLTQAPGDFWVHFDLFRELSDLHSVLGAIEHEGEEYEILFRYYEPDYLFDTGYAPDPLAMPQRESSNDLAANSTLNSTLKTTNKASSRSNINTNRWQQFGSFIRLGVEHIFLGFDHILFLLSLIVVCRFRELVKIVTSFTLAHSITLVLATLEVIQLPSRIVETAIAATIVYVAIENFWIKETKYRWMLTFCFGLIHGFGFAGVLRELSLPTQGLVRSLVGFNVGVELGQLVIVLALFPILTFVTKMKYRLYVQNTISAMIALCGFCWFFDRAFGIDFMPF